MAVILLFCKLFLFVCLVGYFIIYLAGFSNSIYLVGFPKCMFKILMNTAFRLNKVVILT